MQYALEAVDHTPSDVDTQTFDNVTLHTCNKSMLHLLGTKIDWKDDIMGSRFTFRTPNASNCGCGSTFSSKIGR